MKEIYKTLTLAGLASAIIAVAYFGYSILGDNPYSTPLYILLVTMKFGLFVIGACIFHIVNPIPTKRDKITDLRKSAKYIPKNRK